MDIDGAKILLEKKRSERDKFQGRLDSLYEKLEEMGFTDIDQIDQELDSLEKEIAKKEEKRNKLLKNWKKSYGQFLES